jgi:Na+-driven multidrug efflux pump
VSPMLIFGFGPFPQLGIVGGAIAVVLNYTIGCIVFAWYIWSGRGVLKPSLAPAPPTWAPMRDILRVGAASSIVSLSTNITIATATGLAGLVGPAAVAGYGAGVRLEYLLVPLVFGLGAPVAAMVGTSIGAGRRDRALRVAWTGAAIAAALTEAIGLYAAFFPTAWLSLFSRDAEMIEIGSSYLRTVGPFYGFFGGGLALYFASQGAGRVARPMMFAVLRVIIAGGGGWFAVAEFGGSQGLFAVLAFALVFYGLGNVASVAGGAWFKAPGKERAAAEPNAEALLRAR